MSRLPPPLSSPPLLPLPLFFLHLLLFPSPSQIVRHHELFYMALTTRTMAWTATEKIGDIFLSSVSVVFIEVRFLLPPLQTLHSPTKCCCNVPSSWQPSATTSNQIQVWEQLSGNSCNMILISEYSNISGFFVPWSSCECPMSHSYKWMWPLRIIWWIYTLMLISYSLFVVS